MRDAERHAPYELLTRDESHLMESAGSCRARPSHLPTPHDGRRGEAGETGDESFPNLVFQIGIQSVSVWFWFENFLKVASLVTSE